MKHFTKLMLAAVALGASTSASAQFKVETSYRDVFVPMHRAIPSIVDYNNDGNNDVIYGGQNAEDHVTYKTEIDPETGDEVRVIDGHDQWAYYNAETDTWDFLGWQCTANLYSGKGNGEFDSNRGFSWQQWGEGSRITNLGAKGLLPTTYGGYRWFDFDNDGYLDAYVVSRSEWGWNWSWNAYGYSVRDGWFVELQKYNAEKDSFEIVANTPFPWGNNELDTWEESGAANSHISFGDYNNDGYVDVLIQCMKRWKDGEEDAQARCVALFKNNGDGTFTEQKVFNPLPYGENPQPANLFAIDIENPDADPTPTLVARPTSHGATIFGDLNNDGWLDIIITGYCDDGLTFTIYKNNGDGTFDEVDTSDKGFVPTYEGDLALADVNNDGWLDIISYGLNDGGRSADIYLNNGEGDFTFTLSTADEGNGLYPSNRAHLVAVDINHDGRVDLIAAGWTPQDDKGAGTRVHYQDGTGVFELVQEISPFDSGEFGVGDINGDGAVDIIGDFWGRETDTFGPEYNNASFIVMLGEETDGVEAPEAPTDVTASYEDGKITVKWTGDESELGYSYNVYVKNTVTGKISMVVPANIETGKLLSAEDFQVALRSADPSEMSYTISVAGKGDGKYEVGVQTLKNDWTSSAFTKAEVEVTNGIQSVSALGTAKTEVYNANGMYVGNTTNGLSRGIYVVKQGNKSAKIVK